MPVESMAQLIADFARDFEAGDIQNRLFRYRLGTGWQDLSEVRGPAAPGVRRRPDLPEDSNSGLS